VFVRVLSLLLAAWLAATAHAASVLPARRAVVAPPLPSSLTPARLLALPPQMQRAWALQKVALQRSRARDTSVDVTGPTLSRFESRPSVRAGEPLSVRVALDDDLSGVRVFVAIATGAGGSLDIAHMLSSPERHPNALFSADVPRDLPEGPYYFDFAYAIDEAGNVSVFDGAALAAAGRAQVQVSNARRGDSLPLTFVAGTIRTPSLSLSAFSPGTDHPAFAKVSLSAMDTGDLSISGVRMAAMQFCLEDQSSCFTVDGQAHAPGQSNVVLTLAGQPAREGMPAGTYRACWLYGYDWAGHATGLDAAWCGGSTDLSPLLPDGDLITLTP
jgi:hypothetical protein